MFAFATALWPLLAQTPPETPEVKYTVALIAAGGVAGSAIIAGIIAFFAARLNQQKMTILTQQNQLELEKLKGELTDKNQTKLETLRAELNAKAQKELEELRGKIAEQKTEKDARRAYEFEAHKKLYEQCEPLLFQLAELAEGPVARIGSLARTAAISLRSACWARQGDLPRWLAENEYFKLSTLYRLVAPLAILRLFQQRLTLIDLSLDPHIATQYGLLKLSYLVWKDDFQFAQMEPPIDYHPARYETKEQREQNQSAYWRQGIVLGVLDTTIDALLTADPQRPWMTFGAFESAMKDPASATAKAFEDFMNLLDAFHPRNRPILWRILVTQRLIYTKILETRSTGGGVLARLAPNQLSPRRAARSLDWRTPAQSGNEPEVTAEEAVHTPLRIAQEYLRLHLPSVFGDVPATPAVPTEA